MSPLHLASPLSPRRLKRLPLALLLAGSAGWSQAYAAEVEAPAESPAQAAPAKSKASGGQLETVTVTARRREESAQNVP
jgi:iron complex outermembrane receptor protein